MKLQMSLDDTALLSFEKDMCLAKNLFFCGCVINALQICSKTCCPDLCLNCLCLDCAYNVQVLDYYVS